MNCRLINKNKKESYCYKRSLEAKGTVKFSS